MKPQKNTLYVGENLSIMTRLDSCCVDLIYADPPFKTQKIMKGAGGSFSDVWNMRRVQADHTLLLESNPTIENYIQLVGHVVGKDMQAYLIFMAVRLLHMKRILKEQGSIYLHCDPNTSHYLKQIMDMIFGKSNFRNEIIWSYRGMPSRALKWQCKHDVILFYSKSKEMSFRVLKGAPTKGSKKTYQSAMKRGYNVNYSRNMVTIFDCDKYQLAVENGTLPSGLYESIFDGGRPPMRDVWTDIKIIGGPKNKERTGWPTQKPIKLLNRIVKASSCPGGLVFDPFAGSGTTLEAANNLDRYWVGIEQNYESVEIVKRRLSSVNIFKAIELQPLPSYFQTY